MKVYDYFRMLYCFKDEYRCVWWHVDANDWDPCTQPVGSSRSQLAQL